MFKVEIELFKARKRLDEFLLYLVSKPNGEVMVKLADNLLLIGVEK